MAKEDCYFVDCGFTYDGVETSTITGLDHLEAETVQVLGNGAYLGTYTVGGGSITLTSAVTKAQIGLAMTSQLKPSKLDIEELGITTTKKITKAYLNFYNTLGGKFGPDADNLDTITFRDAADSMDDSPDLFSGVKEVSFPGGYEREGNIIIQQDQPLPLIIRGIALDLGVAND